MKRILLIGLAFATAASVYAQGTLTFNNRQPGSIITHIYGPLAGDTGVSKTGNTSSDTPVGTQVYSGASLLSGSGYSVQLWAAPGAGQSVGSLLAVAGSLTSFRTGSAAGFIAAPGDDLAIPGAAANTVATLQVRVWDNLGGTITTWADALALWDAKTNPNYAIGWSPLFNSDPLAGAPPAPPTSFMTGLQSFNIYTNVVPEPSTFVLAGLGAAGLLIFRRRK